MFDEYNDILTVEDAAEMLRMKPHKIYALLKSRELRRLNTGKPYLIPKKEVINFVNRQLLEQNI